MNEASSGQGIVGQLVIGSDEPIGGYADEAARAAISKLAQIAASAHERIANLEMHVAQLIGEKT